MKIKDHLTLIRNTLKKVFLALIGLMIACRLFFQPGIVFSFDANPDAIKLIPAEQGNEALPKGWKELTFPKISRHTLYSFFHEGTKPVIRAESHQSASGLITRVNLNPKVYPYLSWCWKIDRIIEKGDETTRKGDDYAARVYVTFKYDFEKATLWERTKYGALKLIYGEYPPKSALNYVWANHLPVGKGIANPYTKRAEMIAIESGPENVGQWRCELRNINEDYQAFFKTDPPEILGVAIMTDTDNTQEDATAYYSDLAFKKFK